MPLHCAVAATAAALAHGGPSRQCFCEHSLVPGCGQMMPGTSSPPPRTPSLGNIRPSAAAGAPRPRPAPEQREAGRQESQYVALGADPGRQGDAPECASPWQRTVMESPGSASRTVVSLMWSGLWSQLLVPHFRSQREEGSPSPESVGSRGPVSGLSPEDQRETTAPTGHCGKSR